MEYLKIKMTFKGYRKLGRLQETVLRLRCVTDMINLRHVHVVVLR